MVRVGPVTSLPLCSHQAKRASLPSFTTPAYPLCENLRRHSGKPMYSTQLHQRFVPHAATRQALMLPCFTPPSHPLCTNLQQWSGS